MSDYISREAAKKKHCDICRESNICYRASSCADLKCFDTIPAADVRENKRGKWERENIVLTSYPPQYQWHCSECGEIKCGFDSGVLTNFCPNCGADMREEQT